MPDVPARTLAWDPLQGVVAPDVPGGAPRPTTEDLLPVTSRPGSVPDLADAATFHAAVRPVLPSLNRLCMALCRDRAEADDLLQDSLVRAFQAGSTFAGRGSLAAWMSQIVRHQFIETRRAARRRQGLFDFVVSTCVDVLEDLSGRPLGPDPDAVALLDVEAGSLLTALRSLPEQNRLAVLLCDVEGFTHAEAAAALEVPIGTVKSRQTRGRAALQRAYHEALSRHPETVMEEDAR